MVTGRPAHFEARGMAITAANINLNRGTNRLWVDGPGQMELPMQNDLQGRPLPDAGVLQIDWHDKMNFDGSNARFEGTVIGVARQGNLQTEILDVRFAKPVNFSDPQSLRAVGAPAGQGTNGQAQIEQIRCRDGVWIETHEGEPSHLLSIQRMQLVNVTINQISGAVTGSGPGWTWRTAHGSAGTMMPFGPPPVASPAPAAAAAAKDDALNCTVVKFEGPLSGNVRRQEITFHDEVRTAYAPVESWEATLDPDHLESLPPGEWSCGANC